MHLCVWIIALLVATHDASSVHINYVLPTMPQFYDTIGPFPTGSSGVYNDEIGGDVLEAFGGIKAIYDRYLAKRYDTPPSELVDGGRTKWKRFDLSGESFNLKYNETDGVRWPFLINTLGIATIPYLTYAIGTFTLDTLHTDSFLIRPYGCFWLTIDDTKIVCDRFNVGYGWTPIQLDRTKQTHVIIVPIYALQEQVFGIQIKPVTNELMTHEIVLPDKFADNRVAGRYIMWSVMNTARSQQEQYIKPTLSAKDVASGASIDAKLLFDPRVHPTQTVPLVVQLPEILPYTTIELVLSAPNTSPLSITFNISTIVPNKMFTYTYLDLDNTVQYAMALPPIHACTQVKADGKCPVILTTHGAGSLPMWLLPAYQQQNHSWIIAPNGRRRFGFWWTGPQFLTALQSVRALQALVSQNASTAFDSERILFTGHSMGGRGCYMLSTHYADYALAVMCAAGWIKQDVYLPYYTRNGLSYSDGHLRSILTSSELEYSPDLYISHLRGIQFMTRCGGDDDSVHPWHPRKMIRVYNQMNGNQYAGNISEIPGKGHWWDGVVDDAEIQRYFNKYISFDSPIKPALPKHFEIMCNNPARFGGRGGIKPLQLSVPYQIGKMNIIRDDIRWTIRTKNIKRFGLYQYVGQPDDLMNIVEIIIDEQIVALHKDRLLPQTHLCKQGNEWGVCQDDGKWQLLERGPLSYGPIRQIYESAVVIVYGTAGTPQQTKQYYDHAMYLSNHFYYQGRSGILIVSDTEYASSIYYTLKYNIILMGDPSTNLITKKYQSQFPVKFENDRAFSIGDYRFEQVLDGVSRSLGLIFLTPVFDDVFTGMSHTSDKYVNSEYNPRLGVVIAGNDQIGFDLAMKLFPEHTGIPMGDYAVAGTDFLWKGDGGMIASGYWGNRWEFIDQVGFIDEIQTVSVNA